MTEQQKELQGRLENALLAFIERVTNSSSPEAAEIAAVPAMGEVLIKLWGY